MRAVVPKTNKQTKQITNELGCMNVILLYVNHQHVSATHVTILRVSFFCILVPLTLY